MFILGFDGTVTNQDFISLMIRKYIGQRGLDMTRDWAKEILPDVEYFNLVLNNIEQDESVIHQEIESLTKTEQLDYLIDGVKELGGEVRILSTGCAYYMEHFLKHHGLAEKLELWANPGVYKNRNIYLLPDTSSPYYDYLRGIDTGRVIEYFQNRGVPVFFTGSSRADLPAAQAARFSFAQKDSDLASLMNRKKLPYLEYENLGQILHSIRDMLEL